MDVDQHAPFHRVPETRLLDLTGLEHDVTVGQDHRRSKRAQTRECREHVGKQAGRKRIVDQERRHQHQPRIALTLLPVALQRPEVVGVAELAAQCFEDFPVPVTARAELLLQMGA